MAVLTWSMFWIWFALVGAAGGGGTPRLLPSAPATGWKPMTASTTRRAVIGTRRVVRRGRDSEDRSDERVIGHLSVRGSPRTFSSRDPSRHSPEGVRLRRHGEGRVASDDVHRWLARGEHEIPSTA